jgi:hypothetical protein
MAAANKLTTVSYMLKRLRDSGYYAYKLYSDYSEVDPRAWTLVIDPGFASVFCTCYINDPFVGSSYFELYDGGQFIPGRLKITTQSFEVLVEKLVHYGINNKAESYGTRTQKASE